MTNLAMVASMTAGAARPDAPPSATFVALERAEREARAAADAVSAAQQRLDMQTSYVKRLAEVRRAGAS